MDPSRFVVMGAGEVGCHLARVLSADGHSVTMIDSHEEKRELVEDQLDVAFVLGNGSHVPALEAAEIHSCDLFVAASSSDEANLAASLLAKRLGAPRTVVRVATTQEVTLYGRTYEQAFEVDLLLSTQLLATTRILNQVLGYNTLEIEYVARGRLQVRKTAVQAGSLLCRRPLADAGLPAGSLVLAFIRGSELIVPTGADRAEAGDEALIFAKTDAIDAFEKRISGRSESLGNVVIAGGGSTAQAVVEGLGSEARRIKLIEADRSRAEQLAARFPACHIVHGDATDMSTLAAEGVGRARNFIAVTGHDETNLMACLLAQELGSERITALVDRSETSTLWRKVGLLDVVSPRAIAAQRISEYIANNFEKRIVSLESGEGQFIQRRIEAASPVAGERLDQIVIPRGFIVAAVLRHGSIVIPRGDQRFEVGDEVILFVHRSEIATVQLLFPGVERG